MTIIIVLSCAAASIILIVQNNRRKAAWQELNNAARKLVKEQNLTAVLTEGRTSRERVRTIISLSWKGRAKEAFVFDPLEGVRIGRQPDQNSIMIPDREVSLRHCIIFRKKNSREIFLEDLGSANGTVVVHGLRKTRIRARRIPVYDGDRIQVGGMQFQLRIFWIDSAFV